MASSLRLSPTFAVGRTQSFSSLGMSTLPLVSSLPSLVPPSAARLVVVAAAAPKSASAPAAPKKPRGIMKPRRVSPEMQAFLGGEVEAARTQILKQLWAYIKEKNLQDPENKKIIVCDEKLKTVFAGKERVNFLEIAGLISPHFVD